MTRTDTFVVGTLVVLLALVAGLIGVPALQPAASPSAPAELVPTVNVRPYVEGVLGHPDSISPLTARTQVDRDLVALTFAGLVRNGPNGTIVPDLARSWTVEDKGATWTFELRDDARWHDGEPVTADDVLFTIRTLQDPDYSGPSANSWHEVTVTAPSERTVRFALATPLGGFLQALTQPIAPAHLLADVPIDALPTHPFGTAPIGAGPFSLVEVNDSSASLVPAFAGLDPDEVVTDEVEPTHDSLTTPGPTVRPDYPLPYLAGMEFRFFDDATSLADAFREGQVDAASGITRRLATDLGSGDGGHLLRYPGATLTAALLNLRPDHPEFRDANVRTALLAAIDRVELSAEAFAGAAATATSVIPPDSPLFDPKADPLVAYDKTAARKALKAADWTEKGGAWHLPGAKEPLVLEVLSPMADANPGLNAAAAAVARDWRSIGIGVTHTALPAGEFVERLANGEYQVAVADLTIGLDPDLYPLLASSQTLSGRSNVSGVQDMTLDRLLAKARAPGDEAARKQAYSELQKQLAKGRFLLPLAFPDEVVAMRDTVSGASIRQVAEPSDRFWDVLTWRLAADG